MAITWGVMPSGMLRRPLFLGWSCLSNLLRLRGPAADVSDLSETLKNPVLHCRRSQDSKAPSRREPRRNLLIFRSVPPVILDTVRGATLRHSQRSPCYVVQDRLS